MSMSDFGHDHVGVDSPKRVLLLGEKNIVLDTCSLAPEICQNQFALSL